MEFLVLLGIDIINNMIKNCKTCNKEFKTFQSEIKRGGGLYCSLSCIHYKNDRYEIDVKTNCWNWNGYVGNNGYGKLKEKSKSYSAHRFYYEKYRGKIENNMVIDHLCKNRICVNPDHMEVVTLAENTRRGNSAKLNISLVNSIRHLYSRGKSQYKIANIFGIKQPQVSRIVNKIRWSNI